MTPAIIESPSFSLQIGGSKNSENDPNHIICISNDKIYFKVINKSGKKYKVDVNIYYTNICDIQIKKNFEFQVPQNPNIYTLKNKDIKDILLRGEMVVFEVSFKIEKIQYENLKFVIDCTKFYQKQTPHQHYYVPKEKQKKSKTSPKSYYYNQEYTPYYKSEENTTWRPEKDYCFTYINNPKYMKPFRNDRNESSYMEDPRDYYPRFKKNYSKSKCDHIYEYNQVEPGHICDARCFEVIEEWIIYE